MCTIVTIYSLFSYLESRSRSLYCNSL